MTPSVKKTLLNRIYFGLQRLEGYCMRVGEHKLAAELAKCSTAAGKLADAIIVVPKQRAQGKPEKP